MTATRFLIQALTFGGTAVCANDKERTARPQEFDAACERTRMERLAAERQKRAAACVASGRGSQAECEAEHNDYRERSGNRPPLYSDLPECEAAINFQKSACSTR